MSKAFEISTKGVARYVLSSSSLGQSIRKDLLEAVQTASKENSRSLLVIAKSPELCPPVNTISETLRGRKPLHVYNYILSPLCNITS